MIAMNAPGCCGGVVGATILATCSWLTATTTFQMVGASPTDFAVCQDRLISMLVIINLIVITSISLVGLVPSEPLLV